MAWKEVTVMSQRLEFVMLSLQKDVNISELCRRFGLSRKTGYKLLKRYREQGEDGLRDRSRRPKHCPQLTAHETEQMILNLRERHPAWGARKLKRRLEDLGHHGLPAISTITAILKRHGLVLPEESQKHQTWQRFEAERANDLWQMDFKGHFAIRGGRCHPLTLLDDHSRYALCIAACPDQRRLTVHNQLTDVFGRPTPC